VTVDPADPDDHALAPAARALRAGGLVAFPTETVYGLGADATEVIVQYEPIAALNDALDHFYKKTNLDIPIHVDAASGGFVAPAWLEFVAYRPIIGSSSPWMVVLTASSAGARPTRRATTGVAAGAGASASSS
jgi:hypothetical protein